MTQGVFIGPEGGHFRRPADGARYFRPAAARLVPGTREAPSYICCRSLVTS
jgi:hypothetical protein